MKRSTPITDRQKFWIAAGTLIGVMLLATLVFTLDSRYFEPTSGNQAANEIAAAAQPSLDMPDSGHKPTSAGDRGGWEQLALLGLIVVAIGGGTTRLVLTSRRSRRANEAIRR